MDNSDSWERCGKCGGRLDGVLGLCIGECLPKKVSKPKELIPAPQTLWTPITSEASLPKDDEALCLFVQWDFERNMNQAELLLPVSNFKSRVDWLDFTHYTILQPPVK